MKKIAILMLGIDDISGGGGAERQFSDFFDYYQKRNRNIVQLYLITDKNSFKQLKSLNRIKSEENVILIPSFINKKLNLLLWNLYILPILYKNKIDLLHIAIPSYFYIPFLFLLNFIPNNFKPKIVLNAVDCTISYNYFNKNPENSTNQLDIYKIYFKYIKLNAIYSWYEHFKRVFERANEVFVIKPYIQSAKYCFANLKLFKPDKKEKNIVFAGRLIEQKQPLMFVDAIIELSKKNSNIFKDGWKFYIYGKGILRDKIQERIFEYNLQNKLILTDSKNMNEVFSKSMVFVSTQNLENFTSLSMLEAMACGNIIIARNVGQTNYFVKDGLNGFLLKEDTSKDLSQLLLNYINNFEKYMYMQNESIKLAKNIHNIENFTLDLEYFWEKVLSDV